MLPATVRVVAEGTGTTGMVDTATEFAAEIEVEVWYEVDVNTLVTVSVFSVSDKVAV